MEAQLPALEHGVTFLDDVDAPDALHRLVARTLAGADGPAYWVDARNAVSPAALRDHVAGDAVRLARAFTGYQHHELVRSLPATVSPETALVVAPNVASLYVEDDVPGYEADAMYAATLELLDAVGAAVDAPVVLTATATATGAGDGAASERGGTVHERVRQARDAADRVLDAERTREGLRVTGPSFETDVYWGPHGFQTTIPYWVDLLGAVGRGDAVRAGDPAALGV